MKGLIKKVVFVYLYISLFTKKHSRFIFGGFIVGFFLSLLVFKFYPTLKLLIMPQKRIIGIVGNFRENNLPISIQKLISLGLTSVSPDGSAAPAIASSWEATDSGKLYTFHLKPNVIWHDGKKLIASDIRYNIKDTTITSLDDYTFKIQLKDSFSPLPVVLSKPILRNNLIGLGVYKVTNLKFKGETIATITLSPLRDNLPTLEYKFYSNLDEAILGFKLGEIDTLQEVPSKEPFISWKNVDVNEITLYDKFLGVFFNVTDESLKDKETRQGLSFAIPNFPDSQRVYTPIAPSSWAYHNKVRIYKHDPENAKKILEQTPLGTSSAELRLSTYAFYLPFAQKIADAWNALGIKTKVKVETTLPSDYQALLIAQEIPQDPDQYQFWHSQETNSNISHYASLKIDKLLEDGRKTEELEKRKKIYSDFQRYLVDDAPVAFLFFPKVYTIERR